MVPKETANGRRGLDISQPAAGTLVLEISGRWTLDLGLLPDRELEAQLDRAAGTQRIGFDTQALDAWDSSFVDFLVRAERLCERRSIAVDRSGLPPGVQRLTALARAVPARKGARREAAGAPLLTRVGQQTLRSLVSLSEITGFFGEACLAFGRLLRGRARVRRSDVLVIVQECGPEALPIVALISVLIGLILAFVGAIQLGMFGAQIYVANLVAVAMVREMGPIMTGIIMAGRTGAAFAANLGTMQVNEEVSALRTLGIPPMDFLVLPRMLALILMLPLLTIFANVIGMLGGAAIGVLALGINWEQYFAQTRSALGLVDWSGGLVKAAVFGVIVAVVGCWQGMQCERSAAAVGAAATSAVVFGIVLIVASDALFTILYTILGI